MAATVVVTSQAWQDLSEIIEYISRDNPDAAKRFGELLFEAAVSLGQAPRIGCRAKDFPGVRMTVYGRYLILYKLESDQSRLLILRFWHSARDLGSLKLDE
jgi:plasmid stabilization system protein ParE